MPAESSSSNSIPLRDAALTNEIDWPGRLLMLVLNFVPLAHVAAIAAAAAFGHWLGALAILYLAPPLLARLMLMARRIRETHIPIGSRDFFQWWALFQLQVIFCRFPALEELLRLLPGVYSFWLRLWGARIGRLTYWSPGTQISDRSFLEIGDDVVFGAGVRLVPHLIHKSDDAKLELALDKIQIGDRAIIGGYSILAAGTVIGPDESTRAALLSPPFTVWKNGKRA
jgi:acetyltransferase-like isoleucine patch superfamily enzyme